MFCSQRINSMTHKYIASLIIFSTCFVTSLFTMEDSPPVRGDSPVIRSDSPDRPNTTCTVLYKSLWESPMQEQRVFDSFRTRVLDNLSDVMIFSAIPFKLPESFFLELAEKGYEVRHGARTVIAWRNDRSEYCSRGILPGIDESDSEVAAYAVCLRHKGVDRYIMFVGAEFDFMDSPLYGGRDKAFVARMRQLCGWIGVQEDYNEKRLRDANFKGGISIVLGLNSNWDARYYSGFVRQEIRRWRFGDVAMGTDWMNQPTKVYHNGGVTSFEEDMCSNHILYSQGDCFKPLNVRYVFEPEGVERDPGDCDHAVIVATLGLYRA